MLDSKPLDLWCLFTKGLATLSLKDNAPEHRKPRAHHVQGLTCHLMTERNSWLICIEIETFCILTNNLFFQFWQIQKRKYHLLPDHRETGWRIYDCGIHNQPAARISESSLSFARSAKTPPVNNFMIFCDILLGWVKWNHPKMSQNCWQKCQNFVRVCYADPFRTETTIPFVPSRAPGQNLKYIPPALLLNNWFHFGIWNKAMACWPAPPKPHIVTLFLLSKHINSQRHKDADHSTHKQKDTFFCWNISTRRHKTHPHPNLLSKPITTQQHCGYHSNKHVRKGGG